MSTTDDNRTKRNIAVLVAAQAILGAQMPMIFVVGGLVCLFFVSFSVSFYLAPKRSRW